jgi:hypothetical protein
MRRRSWESDACRRGAGGTNPCPAHPRRSFLCDQRPDAGRCTQYHGARRTPAPFRAARSDGSASAQPSLRSIRMPRCLFDLSGLDVVLGHPHHFGDCSRRQPLHFLAGRRRRRRGRVTSAVLPQATTEPACAPTVPDSSLDGSQFRSYCRRERRRSPGRHGSYYCFRLRRSEPGIYFQGVRNWLPWMVLDHILGKQEYPGILGDVRQRLDAARHSQDEVANGTAVAYRTRASLR